MLIAAQILMTCVVRKKDKWDKNDDCRYNTVHMHYDLTIVEE